MSTDLKRKFQELSLALMDLHKNLLMLEAKKMESESGRPLNPYELLHASLHDEKLAWLRSVSQLIVTIDTIIDETQNLSAKETNDVASAVSNLLEKPQPGAAQEFWMQYSKYLSHDPEIIMKHSRVKSLLSVMSTKM